MRRRSCFVVDASEVWMMRNGSSGEELEWDPPQQTQPRLPNRQVHLVRKQGQRGEFGGTHTGVTLQNLNDLPTL